MLGTVAVQWHPCRYAWVISVEGYRFRVARFARHGLVHQHVSIEVSVSALASPGQIHLCVK